MLIASLAITVGSCRTTEKNESSQYQHLTERVGTTMVKEISNPKQVSVARVIRDKDNKPIMAPKPHVLTGDKVAALKKMLLNDQGFFFDKTKKCLFIPEIAFRFENSGKEVVLMFNLGCNQIKFIEGDKTVILDYDPMADALNAFCKEILDQLDKEHHNN
jgi:hypothetical protein